MKLRMFVYGALLATAGCALSQPPAPLPPALPTAPAPAAPAKIAADDVPVLQRINERAAYMQAVTALAAAHSEDVLIKGVAAQLTTDYGKHHDAAQKIAATANLTFSETLYPSEQAHLRQLGRLYGKPFDRAFLYDLSTVSRFEDKAEFSALQKNGSTADIKKLAEEALHLQDRCVEDSKGLMKRQQ